jgi:hypothetical protein
MEFKSQICTTREQSERLLKLGLKKETADCGMYWAEMEERWIYFMQNNKAGILCSLCEDDIPAWSLHRLFEMLYADIGECIIFFPHAYDEVIADIEDCIHRGTFNQDYLEDKK